MRKEDKKAVLIAMCLMGLVLIALTGCDMFGGKPAQQPQQAAPAPAPAPAPQAAAPAAPAAPAAAPAAAGKDASVPTDAKLNLQQGMNYMRAKDFDNAIKEFSLAIEKFPSYTMAYSNRSVAYMQQKKFNKAMDDLKKATEIDPNNAMAHYNFTCLYSLQNQLDRSLDSLDKAMSLGFNEYDALRNDPDLNNVRKHPEFRKILEKYKVFIAK